MLIDFSAQINDLEGNPVIAQLGPGEGERKLPDRHMTLAHICCTALLAVFSDEQNLSGTEKFNRFKLAEKVVAGGEQDIPIEDLATLKKLVGRAFGPLIVGRAYQLLDP